MWTMQGRRETAHARLVFGLDSAKDYVQKLTCGPDGVQRNPVSKQLGDSTSDPCQSDWRTLISRLGWQQKDWKGESSEVKE